jgi:hypothetical protein
MKPRFTLAECLLALSACNSVPSAFSDPPSTLTARVANSTFADAYDTHNSMGTSSSGYLFRFDPGTPRVEVLERIISEPSRRSGMFDQFSYGYLGFALGPDGRTLHYLTGGPIYINGRRVAGKSITAKGESKGHENLHLIGYGIPAGRYTDHGPIFFPDGGRPSYVNSIAVGLDGTVYTWIRITESRRTRTDLICIRSPLRFITSGREGAQ